MKSKKNYADKPFSRCLYCPKRIATPRECKGGRTGPLPSAEWREYMRAIKDVDNLTFDEIAERTNGLMSAQSIQNVLAPGSTRDLTRETARIIENAILGDAASACPVDFQDSASADVKRVVQLEKEVNELRAAIAYLRDQNDRKDRIIEKLLEK